MIAVTALEVMSRLTSSMARFCPYQIDTFFASNVNFGAGSLLAGSWRSALDGFRNPLFGCGHN